MSGEKECPCCMEKKENCVLECQHILCYDCLFNVKFDNRCVICRQEISDIFRSEQKLNFKRKKYNRKFIAQKKEMEIYKKDFFHNALIKINEYQSKKNEYHSKIEKLEQKINIKCKCFTDDLFNGIISKEQRRSYQVMCSSRGFIISGKMGIFRLPRKYIGHISGRLYLKIDKYIIGFFPNYQSHQGEFMIENHEDYTSYERMGFTPETDIFHHFKLEHDGKNNAKITIKCEGHVPFEKIRFLSLPKHFNLEFGCNGTTLRFSQFKDWTVQYL